MIWEIASAPAHLRQGVRKIMLDYSFDLPMQALRDNTLSYVDLGYKGDGSSKERQLMRNYWNLEAIEAAVDKLKVRENMHHSSVAITLNNQAKGSASQGFCMQVMVIVVNPKQSEVLIYYRSTEFVKKFMADLIFFSRKLPELFDRMNIKPQSIKFRFANGYLSTEDLPLYIIFEDRPVSFLRHMELYDPKFFKGCVSALLRFSREDWVYSFQTAQKMADFWRIKMTPDKLDHLHLYLTRKRKEYFK